ncbi:IS1/IS1595 family N-terminal zinc-binding domain-containing protein [Spiroplasma endosymbiont of Clivina fossor]|uniref:IS1/IS1595 family N-terminal zinc-binding domain-containing protein n=1 Tax=Spiroplasma endosymbiont of Clivina fossor TaxID=3066282 RepID=UPI00313AEAA5
MDYQYFLKNNQQLYQLYQVLFLFFFVIFCSPSFKYNSEWIIETQNFGQALKKNGHNSEGKQKYLCKNCRASFDAFRNHFIY